MKKATRWTNEQKRREGPSLFGYPDVITICALLTRICTMSRLLWISRHPYTKHWMTYMSDCSHQWRALQLTRTPTTKTHVKDARADLRETLKPNTLSYSFMSFFSSVLFPAPDGPLSTTGLGPAIAAGEEERRVQRKQTNGQGRRGWHTTAGILWHES